ncbi:glycosyltransferase [Rubellimicrobium arenae]|uniref:glycosyltransferase n=1 Tax=Rubellimicrobium arenae TaxID=2817372 RepID=UPI001B316EB0|nr:glycosyltransferase [Rubellimicrobium arenae]
MDSRAFTSRSRQGRRIAFIVEKLAQRSGGAERVLIETANALAARGHSVEIITHEYRGAPPFYPLAPGVMLSNLRNLHRSRLKRRIDGARSLLERAPDVPGLDRLVWFSRHGSFWRQLSAHLQVMQPDVAVAFMPPAISALALAKIPPSVRRVASIHNVPEQEFMNPERWDSSRLDRRRRLELLSRFDRITVLLPEHRDWFAPDLRPAISVIPNAIEPVPPERIAAAARENVVMAVGRLATVKRNELLLEAWSRLAPEFPDWSLQIFGVGPLQDQLAARIEASELQSAHLMGHVPDIKDRYLRSAILAHPAEFEGFGLAPAEALAAGLPVVGFADCSGVNTLVQDQINGLLVPGEGDRVANYASALASLMRDGALRARLGAQGPASMSVYAPPIIIDGWEQIIFGDHAPELRDMSRQGAV